MRDCADAVRLQLDTIGSSFLGEYGPRFQLFDMNIIANKEKNDIQSATNVL